MCQATAYLDGQQILEDVIWLEPVRGGFILQTLFDEPRRVEGRLEGIDLLKHRVLLVSDRGQSPGDPQSEGGKS